MNSALQKDVNIALADQAQIEKQLKLVDALERLQTNADYQLVFEDTMFDKRQKALTQLLVQPAIRKDEKNYAGVLFELECIASLQSTLNLTLNSKAGLDHKLAEIKAFLEKARSGELDEEYVD